MIAVAGLARLAAGQHADLAIRARAQWALSELPPLPRARDDSGSSRAGWSGSKLP